MRDKGPEGVFPPDPHFSNPAAGTGFRFTPGPRSYRLTRCLPACPARPAAGAGAGLGPELVHQRHRSRKARLIDLGPVLFLEGEGDGLEGKDLPSPVVRSAPGSPGPPGRQQLQGSPRPKGSDRRTQAAWAMPFTPVRIPAAMESWRAVGTSIPSATASFTRSSLRVRLWRRL